MDTLVKSVRLCVLTSIDGDLLSHFDKIDESQAEINNTSLKHLLVNKHDIAANQGKIIGHLPFEQILNKHLDLVECLKKLLDI